MISSFTRQVSRRLGAFFLADKSNPGPDSQKPTDDEQDSNDHVDCPVSPSEEEKDSSASPHSFQFNSTCEHTTTSDTDSIHSLWEKLVAVTRDTSVSDHLKSINVDQWNLGLNEFNVSCEPGLSKKIFKKISSHERGKLMSSIDFETNVTNIRADVASFEYYVHMSPNEVLGLHRADDEELLVVLFAKIVSALLNSEPFDAESLLKERFEITPDMSTDDLLKRLSDPDWEIRVKILDHLYSQLKQGGFALSTLVDEESSSSIESTDISSTTLLNAWVDQFSDQRSQLVKYALSTFPEVVNLVLIETHDDDINLRAIFEGLFVPIRAKRSTKIQQWGHECCTEIVRVLLNKHSSQYSSVMPLNALLENDVEEDVDCPISPRIMELTEIFCRNIKENDKYEKVRQRCLSYLIQIFDFHCDFADVKLLFENGSDVVVEALNSTLLDKKSAVREEAFRLMKLLERLEKDGRSIDVRMSVKNSILSRIEEKARLRYDRSSSSKKKRRTSGRKGRSVDIAAMRSRLKKEHSRKLLAQAANEMGVAPPPPGPPGLSRIESA